MKLKHKLVIAASKISVKIYEDGSYKVYMNNTPLDKEVRDYLKRIK